VIEILTFADEFQEILSGDAATNEAFQAFSESFKSILDEKLGERLDKSKRFLLFPWSYRVAVYLYAHVLRVPIENDRLYAGMNQKWLIMIRTMCCG
jgi:hypothetical protein